MRIAHLSACTLDAAMLEESVRESTLAADVVWTAHGPEQLLAALDHRPDVILLDMRWSDAALAMGETIRQVGGIRIICRFPVPDLRLEQAALARGFELLHGPAPWSAFQVLLGGRE